MFAGRTVEQKRDLVEELTQAFVRTAGGSTEAIHVVITDISKENWGLGDTLAIDKFPDK